MNKGEYREPYTEEYTRHGNAPGCDICKHGELMPLHPFNAHICRNWEKAIKHTILSNKKNVTGMTVLPEYCCPEYGEDT